MMLNYRLLIKKMYKFIIFFNVLLQLKSKIKNDQHKCHNVGDTKQRRYLKIWIYIPNGVMADITPSSQHPCAEIFKIASHEPIMNPIIDGFGQTVDWL